ncbi:MAG TPA: PLP-dependent aminotransferase family protein [Flavihumibacter sp.]|jgi:GntR family transcriptional regulator/MocR family aminotransferase
MASPVSIPFHSFIHFDRQSETPVYLQIAHQLINAVQRRYLPTGTRLPGSRQLGQILRVHRNTIIAVYEELEAQGWVETRPNKGTFIIGTASARPAKIPSTIRLQQYPLQTGFEFRQSSLLDPPAENSNCRYHFNDGTPDIRLMPIDQLSRRYSASLKRRMNRRQVGYTRSEGNPYLRRQLANFLNLTRGLHISEQNILLTRSTEMSVYITAHLLLGANDTIIVGSPSYYAMNMIFQQTGAKIKTVAVDREGIDVDAVRRLCESQKIRMLYLTPHHHYPTTVTLSAERRLELLQLAAQHGFIIFEDDYDYDFHFDKKQVLPLASADTAGMVIYSGSFGRSLAPGFRTGFIVAPENLIHELRKHLQVLDRQGDPLLEQVLGELIEEGEVHRLIKKTLPVYEARRNQMAVLLKQLFGEQIRFETPGGGLAFWTEWTRSVNLLQMSKLCESRDLFIPRTLLYQSQELTAMRIGFGHLTESEMEEQLQKMAACLQELGW